MNIQRTIAIIKPEFPEKYSWDISISRERFKQLFETILTFQWLEIIDEYQEWMEKEKVETHYQEKKDHPLFPQVVEYMSSGVSDILLIEGENAISQVRKTALQMREEFLKEKHTKLYNAIHSSDSLNEAQNEISHLFWKKSHAA